MHTIRLKDDYIKLGQAKNWYPEIKWNMMARPS